MDKNKEIIGKQVIEVKEEYSGLIPHPNIVTKYEQLCPGATDRILKMTETQLAHNHQLEKKEQENIMECRIKALDSEITIQRRGQLIGALIIFIGLIGGFYLCSIDREIQGYSTLVATVLLYFGAVIYKKDKK